MTKQERVDWANEIIRVVAKHGRHFFAHDGRVSFLKLDKRGRVWFVDSYTGKAIYVAHPWGNWQGFSNGGTLRSFVMCLYEIIAEKENTWESDRTLERGGYYRKTVIPDIMRHLGPWPKWRCHGDLWGYGADMEVVREECQELVTTALLSVEARKPSKGGERTMCEKEMECTACGCPEVVEETAPVTEETTEESTEETTEDPTEE